MPKVKYPNNPLEEEQRASKKPRFDYRNPSTLAADGPEEDTILELDEIGRSGQQTKRNAIRLEGYESDSSTENFDSRAEAKARDMKKAEKEKGKGENGTRSKDEEDGDMFADIEEEEFNDGDEDEELAQEGKQRKKEVRFLDDKDIDGQVSNSKSGGHVSADFSLGRKSRSKDRESSSDESGDDETRDEVPEGMEEELGAGAKKKHAPKVDAFNMRDEAEEGQFDESGNFVRKAADPFAVHDSWLEGSSKRDMRKAKEAEDKRERDRRKRDQEDDAIPTGQTLGTLIERLQDEETILEALARLGTSKEKKKPKWHKNRRKASAAMDLDEDEDPAEKTRKAHVEAITAAADRLLTQGQSDIYDAERALLVRQYRRETGEDWVDQAGSGESNDSVGTSAVQYEYRWSDARDGGGIHGPYDGATMTSWNDAGYFGEGVEFRTIGSDDWTAEVNFR